MGGRLNTWLLLLVVICAFSLWLGRDLLRQEGTGSVSVPPERREIPSFTESADQTPVHLVVLNGTDRAGLAREISLLLGRAGCVAERIGNAPRLDCEQSFLVNRRLSDGRAADIAVRLGGLRVIREWDERGGEDAVLVLGADHGQVAENLRRGSALAGE